MYGKVAHQSGYKALTSKDGAVWTKSPAKPGSPARMFVSKDGASWMPHDIDGLQYARVIETGDGYLLVTSDTLYVSADAEKWDKLDMDPQNLMPKSVAYDSKTSVSVGRQGSVTGGEGNVSDPYRIIGTSGNLTGWNVVKTDKMSPLTSVVWADSRFAAVGGNGTILTSRDGLSGWTQAASPTSNNLLSIVWDGSGYIATGEKGTILYSRDGAHWIKEKSATSGDLCQLIPAGRRRIHLFDLHALYREKGAGSEPEGRRIDRQDAEFAKEKIGRLE